MVSGGGFGEWRNVLSMRLRRGFGRKDWFNEISPLPPPGKMFSALQYKPSL